jgi:hypothetical protein
VKDGCTYFPSPPFIGERVGAPLRQQWEGEGPPSETLLYSFQQSVKAPHQFLIAKRMPRYLCASSQALRRESWINSSGVSRVTPSISIMSFASRQQKSAKNGPLATCRENITPPSCRLRRYDQSLVSVVVCSRRSIRARTVDFWFGPRIGSP